MVSREPASLSITTERRATTVPRPLLARIRWSWRGGTSEADEAVVGRRRHRIGGRHELYEINYSGSHEEIRRYALFGAVASGSYDRFTQFVDTCLAEEDLAGWKAADLAS